MTKKILLLCSVLTLPVMPMDDDTIIGAGINITRNDLNQIERICRLLKELNAEAPTRAALTAGAQQLGLITVGTVFACTSAKLGYDAVTDTKLSTQERTIYGLSSAAFFTGGLYLILRP